MTSDKENRIPDILLDQLSEWSCGGFMLFNFDEDGNPQVYSKAEDEMNAMSLQYFVSHWSNAMETMNSDSFMNNLNMVFKKHPNEDDEEEEGFQENE
ncbi:MAG TPA: hypothetical protein EYN22_03685 [Nitrospinaceae bacterium]|jgi:hypothetical protein|nr:hypothetical protein [Flavobacteriales bacterium]HIO23478.1 hypothetical protein [Nitrospinaceae bacterium]